MGAMSRRKGKAGERQLAEVLRNLGVEARRGVQFHGGPDSPDVISSLPGIHWEVKRVESFQLYPSLAQASNDAPEGATPVVAHRRNGKDWVAILDLRAFVRIVQGMPASISTSAAGGEAGGSPANHKE